MNLFQDKKIHSYNSIHSFFIEYGAQLIALVPSLAAVIAQFEALYLQTNQPAMDILEESRATTVGKNRLKEECREGLWKLTSAMQFHFANTNNTIAANTIKISRSVFRKLTEKEFYNFSQIVMNQYVPAVYTPYGIIETEMDALKIKLQDFPNQMEATDEARLKRKLAGQELDSVIAAITLLLKSKIDRLMEVARPDEGRIVDLYYRHRRYGIIKPTHGLPHRKGKIGPGETKLLAKHVFRRKLALVVSNPGPGPLEAGIGHKETKMHGTPFTILPGQTRKRICQKLASGGEYLLIKNSGDVEGEYEVWMKE